ncbi:hypothetical protein BT96DRAFT_996008 [Gymnopus androsaceus JB14]|uniref:Uncharacterized protein n=1 Tax=Gymnopus androsaceus JB14 TaxID=1447944 RepID=A0A6A4HHL8_9AGAR|nr:hypothetical protein BT96DRAFT_996008 [Gymnopus androsaceus JB14]
MSITATSPPLSSATKLTSPAQSPEVGENAEGEVDVVGGLAELDREGWPTWIKKAWDTLSGERVPVGPNWKAAITNWVRLEEHYGYENPNGAKAWFPSAGRPSIVGWWAQNAKTTSRVLQDKIFGNVLAFEGNWWKWWLAMNPGWREQDAEGRIVVSGEGEGTSLYFKSQHLEAGKDISSWEAAVEDAGWVIEQLEKEKRLYPATVCAKKQRADMENCEEAPPSKRTHTRAVADSTTSSHHGTVNGATK